MALPGTNPPDPRSGGAGDASKVKGTLLLARIRYLTAAGPASREAVLGRVPAADRAILGGIVLPSSWYPAAVMARFETAIAAILAQGDRSRLFVDLGRFSADANLGPGGVQRPYLREGDPHFVLRHVPRMYGTQHSAGQRTYEATGPTSAVIRSEGAPGLTPEDCLTTLGWLQRAIALSGGREPRVTEGECAARGAARCEYLCEWR